MKYYQLVRGDYVQSGDEYFDVDSNKWKPIKSDFYGKIYGYAINGKSAAKWVKIRRLVPEDFIDSKHQKRTIGVPIQEQYGLEFES